MYPHYERCLTIFKEMAKEAGDANMFEQPTFIGHIKDVFDATEISYSYYSDVMKDLQKHNCIQKIKRGSGTTYGIWLIHSEPIKELFLENYNRRRITYGNQILKLDERVRRLEEIVYGYDDPEEDS